jgi:hypothetical protein
MVEAVHASETSDYFNETTWRYIPGGCHHTRRRENLKPHKWIFNSCSQIRDFDYHSEMNAQNFKDWFVN